MYSANLQREHQRLLFREETKGKRKQEGSPGKARARKHPWLLKWIHLQALPAAILPPPHPAAGGVEDGRAEPVTANSLWPLPLPPLRTLTEQVRAACLELDPPEGDGAAEGEVLLPTGLARRPSESRPRARALAKVAKVGWEPCSSCQDVTAGSHLGLLPPAPPPPGPHHRRGRGMTHCLEFLQGDGPRGHSFYFSGFPSQRWGLS